VDREHAFTDSDLRLLTTLANSMSVALENARLFDETQRLLKVTEDRAAELAIINSVQEGLASKLEMQAIYDLVGDKLSEVMNSLDIDIRLFLPETDQVLYPYVREHGERLEVAPSALRGMAKHVFETRQTLVVNEKLAERMEELGSTLLPGTQMEKSFMAVPILVGGRALGMVSISNYEEENAFGESDVRLLQTVVSAMSVALENARLFDETQRLLKETEERNADLAVINRVGQVLTQELDPRAIVDSVGERCEPPCKPAASASGCTTRLPSSWKRPTCTRRAAGTTPPRPPSPATPCGLPCRANPSSSTRTPAACGNASAPTSRLGMTSPNRW
jgi:GAF domain-containing protein